MRRVRTTATAVLLLLISTVAVHGQCVSSVELISARGLNPRFLAGPTAWNGNVLAIAGPELDREEFQVVLYDEHGNRLGANEKIRSAGEDLLQVIWNGSEFGVFSIDEDDNLALTRVATSGLILEPRVISIAQIPLNGDDTAEIAWHAQFNQYVVAYTHTSGPNRDIKVTWLKRDGTVVRQMTVDDAASDSFLHLAIAASGTIGVFYEDESTRDVMYVAITDDKKKPVPVWDDGNDITVAAHGNQFAMIRPVLLGTTGDMVARWQVIDTSAQEVRRDSRLNLGTGADVEPLELLVRDSEFALSFFEWPEGFGIGDPTYRLARFGFDEEFISDTYFAAAVGTRRRRERTDFGFVWTGSAYLSLGSNENGDDDDTYLVRLCPLRAGISAPRSARTKQPVTFTASPDGGVPGYSYSWHWGDSATAEGPTAQFAFPTAGTYTVTLTVKDSSGTTATSDFQVAVSDPKRRAVRR